MRNHWPGSEIGRPRPEDPSQIAIQQPGFFHAELEVGVALVVAVICAGSDAGDFPSQPMVLHCFPIGGVRHPSDEDVRLQVNARGKLNDTGRLERDAGLGFENRGELRRQMSRYANGLSRLEMPGWRRVR